MSTHPKVGGLDLYGSECLVRGRILSKQEPFALLEQNLQSSLSALGVGSKTAFKSNIN